MSLAIERQLLSFRPGDLVRLRSGGPDMVVESIDEAITGSSAATVAVWFHEDGSTFRRETFATACLELVPS